MSLMLWIAALVLLVVAFAYRWARKRFSSAATVDRWARRGRRHQGMASRLALFVWTSRWAMLRKACAVRPSLAELPRWRLWFRVPVTEFAVPLVKIGGRWAYGALEDVTLRVGGPRTGKSVELLGKAVDAPGAILVTSTRTDLLDAAAPARMERLGQAAAVFNPSGVGGIASTVKFSPLHGCRSAQVAYARAEDMIGGREGSGGDAERWDAQARRVLALLMHAAAMADTGMHSVQRWIADPQAQTTRSAVLAALRQSPQASAMEADFTQFITTNVRTLTSITSTIMPALGWLNSPDAVGATEAGGDPFDVAELLANRGQVYLLGAQDGLASPLIGAFTGYIAREARRLARLAPGGRLDPPLTCILDEASLVPVDLPNWTADMGGSGITLHIAVQGRSQLERTWGREGAATILNNSATVLVFGGVRDKDDLETWSTLSGHRLDEDQRRVPALSPAEVSQLPAWRVLAVLRSMPASIGRVPKTWRRRDIAGAVRRYRAPSLLETNYGDLPDPEGDQSD